MNPISRLWLSYLSFKKLTEEDIENWYELLFFRFGLIHNVVLRMRRGGTHVLSLHQSKIVLDDICFIYFERMQFNDTLHIIIENFLVRQYGMMNVKGKIVIDIGATVADASMSFIKNGAKHVYAYELFPYVYKVGAMNLIANDMTEQVSLRNIGVAGSRKVIKIPSSHKSYGGYGDNTLRDFGKGKQVKIITLQDGFKVQIEKYKDVWQNDKPESGRTGMLYATRKK